MNKNTQQGFTLIELVVVIVILGIMAATALPKFVDLSSEAGTAAANGVAGSLASASSVNYAAKVAGKTSTVALSSADVCDAATLEPLISGIDLLDADPATWTSNSYVVSGTGNCSGANAAGTAVTCQIKGQKGTAVNATIICSGA